MSEINVRLAIRKKMFGKSFFCVIVVIKVKVFRNIK